MNQDTKYLPLIPVATVIMSVYETCSEKIGAITNESLPLLLECLSDTQEEVREKWHAMSLHSKESQLISETLTFCCFPSQQYIAS